MTAETFTESTPSAPMGPPEPTGPAEAIGWVCEVTFQPKDKGPEEQYTLRGVVRDATWSRLEIQFDGECGRKCCLESVEFKYVNTWIGWVPCHCGSGTPEMLCLCEEVEAE